MSKTSSKHFKATVAMSEEFPMKVDMLLAVLEVIAPQFKHFNKLRDFVKLKLPPGFPIQVNLPVLPTVSAKVTFTDFTWMQEGDADMDQAKFEIPSAYNLDPCRWLYFRQISLSMWTVSVNIINWQLVFCRFPDLWHLEEVSMVLVEPRKRHLVSSKKSSFSRRHSYRWKIWLLFNIVNLIFVCFSGSSNTGPKVDILQPAVDFPIQFNFGSPYSSSLTIFFDFWIFS